MSEGGGFRPARLWMAAATSLVVAGAVMAVGFQNFLGEEFFGGTTAVRRLEIIGETAMTLKAQTGKIPSSLEELTALAREKRLQPFIFIGEQVLTDFCDRPYLYEVRGDHVTVRTLGSDQAPGGAGIDEDLECELPYPEGYFLHKAGQFVRTRGFRVTVAVAAGAAFQPLGLWLLFEVIRRRGGHQPGLVVFSVPTIAISAIAFFAALVILMLHEFPHH